MILREATTLPIRPALPAGPTEVFFELENNSDLHEAVSWDGTDVTVKNMRTGETLTVDITMVVPFNTVGAAA